MKPSFRHVVAAAVVAAGFFPAGATVALEPLLHDDFSEAALPQRRALRGAWKFAGNTAACTQDDALYAKFKNHGPIIFYDVPLTDARIRFAYRADGARNVVFTANGEHGHVARVIWTPKGTVARAFRPDDPAKSEVVAQDDAPLPIGTWVPVEVVLEGSRMTVKAGDGPAKVYDHATYARPKTNLSIGFAFGTLAVRDVVVEPIAASR